MHAITSEIRILISAIDILRDIKLDSYILKEINDHPECRRTMMIYNIYVASASSNAAPHKAEVEEMLSSALWRWLISHFVKNLISRFKALDMLFSTYIFSQSSAVII
jgi:hypothetical protein